MGGVMLQRCHLGATTLYHPWNKFGNHIAPVAPRRLKALAVTLLDVVQRIVLQLEAGLTAHAARGT